MLPHCLKCRKIQKVKTQKLQRQKEENQCFYQNVHYVTIKTKYLLRSKKANGLLS